MYRISRDLTNARCQVYFTFKYIYAHNKSIPQINPTPPRNVRIQYTDIPDCHDNNQRVSFRKLWRRVQQLGNYRFPIS